jgi:hypothetical protein
MKQTNKKWQLSSALLRVQLPILRSYLLIGVHHTLPAPMTIAEHGVEGGTILVSPAPQYSLSTNARCVHKQFAIVE